MHLNEGEIRAYLDRQLEMAEARRVEAHLSACPRCRESADAALARSARVQARVSAVGETGYRLDPAAARRKLNERLHQQQEDQENQSMWHKVFGKISRPLWAGMALVAVLAVALAFPQVRAAADSFLQLFRVEQVRLLPVDMESLSTEMRSSQQLEALFTENVEVVEKGERADVAAFDEAAALAGFALRQLSGVEGETRYSVDPGADMTFKVDLEMARAALREMGRDDIQLPDSLDGAVIKVEAPTSVTTLIGECATRADRRMDPDAPEQAPAEPATCTALTQAPSPVISAPPEMNLEEMGKLYLQVLGMTEEEAGLYASSVNWATTLVMPVPQGNGDFEEVSVNGVQGIFAHNRYYGSQEFTLMWVQNGIVYILNGNGGRAEALDLAASIK